MMVLGTAAHVTVGSLHSTDAHDKGIRKGIATGECRRGPDHQTLIVCPNRQVAAVKSELKGYQTAIMAVAPCV